VTRVLGDDEGGRPAVLLHDARRVVQVFVGVRGETIREDVGRRDAARHELLRERVSFVPRVVDRAAADDEALGPAGLVELIGDERASALAVR
jgi:hypothetical protein